MSDAEEPLGEEKTRICPSCRMRISVLAVKCRFCGEEVGRPKEEARELTMQDLGGETIYHRAPSGSVMEALESFRVEEASVHSQTPEPKHRSSVFKRKAAKPETPAPKRSELPELDERSLELAALSSEPSTIIGGGVRKRTVSRSDRLMRGLWAVFGAIVVIVGIKGIGWAWAYIKERNRPPEIEVVNRAPELLAHGRNIEALQAAREAYEKKGSDQNVKILLDAQNAVVAQIEDMLNAAPWANTNLDTASRLANDALNIHPSEITRRIRTEVSTELQLYRMVLLEADPQAGTATFQLNRPPENPVVKYRKGDMIEDRFVLRNVWRNVAEVSDTKRLDRHGNERKIRYETQ